MTPRRRTITLYPRGWLGRNPSLGSASLLFSVFRLPLPPPRRQIPNCLVGVVGDGGTERDGTLPLSPRDLLHRSLWENADPVFLSRKATVVRETASRASTGCEGFRSVFRPVSCGCNVWRFVCETSDVECGFNHIYRSEMCVYCGNVECGLYVYIEIILVIMQSK